MTQHEEWRTCHITESYLVSNLGRVKSLDRKVPSCFGSEATKKGCDLRTILKRNGYFVVKILGRQRLVHDLVLHAFVGNRPEGMQACHYDGNRLNNAAANLRWDTVRANTDDKLRHRTVPRGSLAACSKLTESDVLTIRRDGRSRKSIAKDYGVTPEAISSIVLRKTWRHV